MSSTTLLDTPSRPRPSLAASLLSALAAVVKTLVLAPLFLVLALLVSAVWILSTVSLLGPALHFCAARRDAALLAAAVEPAAGAVVTHVTVPGGGRLAVRWSPGGKRAHPVCIPNGLGATLVTISTLHERLVALGFSVLTYDRDGVGMSDARRARAGGRAHATAAETVADMRAVMDAVAPGARWILVGPSMGSIVAQCFVAAHPERVVGLLNMDGLPFPFATKRRRFELAAVVYKVYAALIWTGVVRAGLSAAARALAPLASAAFSVPLIVAQMNQRSFFASLACEMLTMMDCADAASAAWGPSFDIAGMPRARLVELANAAPAACGDVVAATTAKAEPTTPPADAAAATTWVDLPRSVSEVGGSAWTPQHAVKDALIAAADATAAGPSLPRTWRTLSVRVMSARSYDFGALGELFYDKDMRLYAGAEHNLHALLARSGARTVFPSRHHGMMFFGMEGPISDQVVAIDDDIASASS
jgi:pimeloyl-ACP methyl ester carboxylesterase